MAAPPLDEEPPELVEPANEEDAPLPGAAEVDDAITEDGGAEEEDAATNDVAAAEEDVPAEDGPEVMVLDEEDPAEVAPAEDDRAELDTDETALLFMVLELVPREDVTVVLVEPAAPLLEEDGPGPPELLLLESPTLEVHAPRASRDKADKTRRFIGHPLRCTLAA